MRRAVNSETMNATGTLRKLEIDPGEPAEYRLPVGDERIALNPLIGKRIALEFTGVIRCIACGRVTRKSFNQGYCYPCFKSLAQCDMCILRPEFCHYHEGTCREPEWGRRHCMQPHVVYLAATSDVKVGITRKSQIPVRWLDQGATRAMAVFETPTRRDAGLIEAALKAHVADRTDWRAMLRGDAEPVDLEAQATALLDSAAGSLASWLKGGEPPPRLESARQHAYAYPVACHPSRVRSVSFDKVPSIEGLLVGMKGQYLILDTAVTNIRRHAGYEITFSCEGWETSPPMA